MKNRRIRTYLPPLVAILMAAVSATSLVLLESRDSGYRTAQATLSNISAQSALVSVVPADVAQGRLLPTKVAATVGAVERAVDAQVADLQRHWQLPILSTLSSRLHRNFASILDLIQRGTQRQQAGGRAAPIVGPPPPGVQPSPGPPPPPPGASAPSSLGSGSVEGSERAVQVAIGRANREYEQLASAAQTEAIAGTFLTILVLLGAFLFFYGRWVRTLRRTHRDARTDTLTGLGNRRALIEHLEDALSGATPERPLVLTLYDLDGFKAYNDSRGHLAGDALLTRFARRLQESLGGIGTAYRMGGDEFCSLAHVAPGDADEHVIRTRAALSESDEDYEVRCSAGTVLLPAEATTVRAALSLADRRMYEQKGLVTQ